jgi:hypothetical protein
MTTSVLTPAPSTTWERHAACTSDHIGDAPVAHIGGHDVLGRLHYRRNYADGCSVTTVTDVAVEQ